jgi:hypothetical protein
MYRLQVLESLNLGMVVGLSVDYVVHLAEAYRLSTAQRRMERVRNMLESIGLSVLSGAITTFGAATFMLFSEIQFLYEFGVFVMTTVGLSLMFSLFGFTTCMALCGPQGNTGDISAVWTSLVGLVRKLCPGCHDAMSRCQCKTFGISCLVCTKPRVGELTVWCAIWYFQLVHLIRKKLREIIN